MDLHAKTGGSGFSSGRFDWCNYCHPHPHQHSTSTRNIPVISYLGLRVSSSRSLPNSLRILALACSAHHRIWLPNLINSQPHPTKPIPMLGSGWSGNSPGMFRRSPLSDSHRQCSPPFLIIERHNALESSSPWFDFSRAAPMIQWFPSIKGEGTRSIC